MPNGSTNALQVQADAHTRLVCSRDDGQDATWWNPATGSLFCADCACRIHFLAERLEQPPPLVPVQVRQVMA